MRLIALAALVACNGGGEGCAGADSCTDAPDTDRGDTDETDAPREPVVVLTLDAVVDECRPLCGHVAIVDAEGTPRSFALESELDGFLLLDEPLRPDGTADFCVDGPRTPGVHRVAAVVDDVIGLGTVDVRPFGWAYGLDKPSEPLDAPWFVPAFDADELTAPPVLPYSATSDEGWDTVSAMAPSTVVFGGQRFVYFSGTPDVTFGLGVAWNDDGGLGGFVKHPGNPILTAAETGAVEGDWDYQAQNTPEALVRDGRVWLYYNGRAEATGGLGIGLATSEDGVSFERQGPVLLPTGDDADFDGNGVAHPSVEVRPVDFADNEAAATEVFELWYASGSLELGYAISADGLAFERYCGGPVFGGDEVSWDEGSVKAPEVVVDDQGYHMTYSGCGQGCYQVGWAQSADGIRWVAAGAPVIPVQQGPAWNSYGTQEAFVEVDGPVWRFWYAGTGDSHGSIGFVDYEPP